MDGVNGCTALVQPGFDTAALMRKVCVAVETYMIHRTESVEFLRGGETLYNHTLYTTAKYLDIWSHQVHRSTRCHAFSGLKQRFSDRVEYYDGPIK